MEGAVTGLLGSSRKLGASNYGEERSRVDTLLPIVLAGRRSQIGCPGTYCNQIMGSSLINSLARGLLFAAVCQCSLSNRDRPPQQQSELLSFEIY